MLKEIQQFKDYLSSQQLTLLVILLLGMLSLTIREVPFLNLYFPTSTPLIVISLGIIILFNLYRQFLFWLFLILLTLILYLGQVTTQAEELADFIFVILLILVLAETKNFLQTLK